MARVAVVQMVSSASVKDNLSQLDAFFVKAREESAELLVLPENFAFMGMNETDKLNAAEEAGNGVIQQTIKQMLLGKGADQANLYLSKIKAYIGPSIGPKHFEVGVDVYQSFVNKLSQNQMNQCFVNGQNQGKYFANLFQIARNVLSGLGIEQIFTEEICCYENKNLFFSHRRDKQSGRFGSFIWKEDL